MAEALLYRLLRNDLGNGARMPGQAIDDFEIEIEDGDD